MSLQNTFKTWYVSGMIWMRLNGDLLGEYIFLYLFFWLSMLIFEGKDYHLTNTSSVFKCPNESISLILPLVHSLFFFFYYPCQHKQYPSSACWIFQWLKIALMFSLHNLFSQIVNLGFSMIYKLIQQSTIRISKFSSSHIDASAGRQGSKWEPRAVPSSLKWNLALPYLVE